MRALNCLRLELAEEIVSDVHTKFLSYEIEAKQQAESALAQQAGELERHQERHTYFKTLCELVTAERDRLREEVGRLKPVIENAAEYLESDLTADELVESAKAALAAVPAQETKSSS